MEDALKNALKVNEIAHDDKRKLEVLFYPYFNRELIKYLNMNEILGFGTGRITVKINEIIDCLIISTSNEKVAIEIKGPDQKANLLIGVADKQKNAKIQTIIEFTSDIESLFNCLIRAYSGTKDELQADSVIGDVIKLANLLVKGQIKTGYIIGLLKYTELTPRKDEYLAEYWHDLNEMVNCLKQFTKKFDIRLKYKNIEDIMILMSIIEIKSY
ncbi:MAG: hypothetical protein ACTSQ8_20485, partial [Candidatus Helarchaeota archaeon]